MRTERDNLTSGIEPAGGSKQLRVRLISGLFWNLTGASVVRLAGLATGVLIGRILGKEDFGRLGMIQSTVGMLGSLAGLAMGAAATRYIGSLRLAEINRASLILRLLTTVGWLSGGAIATALMIFAPYIATHWLGTDRLIVPLQLSAVLVIFGVINGIQAGALAGLEAFREIARVNLICGLLTLPIVLGLTFYFRVAGVVVGLALVAVLNFVLYRRVLRKSVLGGAQVGSDRMWAERSILLKFALPLTLSTLMTAPAGWLGNFLLLRSPEGYASVGLFNAALQWQSIILFVPGAISPAILSLLSNTYGREHTRSYWKLVYTSLAATVIASLIAAAAVAVAGENIMALYGREFHGGGAPIVLLSIAAVLMAANTTIGQVITSSGSMWASLGLNALWAFGFVVSAFVLVPSRGAVGLGLAYCLAYTLLLIWSSIYLFYQHWRPNWRNGLAH